jgi:hypothetical protein
MIMDAEKTYNRLSARCRHGDASSKAHSKFTALKPGKRVR